MPRIIEMTIEKADKTIINIGHMTFNLSIISSESINNYIQKGKQLKQITCFLTGGIKSK